MASLLTPPSTSVQESPRSRGYPQGTASRPRADTVIPLRSEARRETPLLRLRAESRRRDPTGRPGGRSRVEVRAQQSAAAAAGAAEPLKIIISGAPASGKGTQCELIVEKFGLVHISAGDLLRAEVQGGTPNGLLAKSFMDAGQLVPDEVVIKIVKDRLTQADAQERGWLLDGFPRSASQGNALVADGIVPDAFVLLNVPDKVIVERVVGRRMDPVSGKIYHLTFSPPPNDPEVLGRLVQRSDDTADKVQARLDTHARNVGNVLDLYKGKITEVDGNRGKDAVFADIAAVLTAVQEEKRKAAVAGST